MSTAASFKPSPEDVKRLRERTKAGMIECRNALVEAQGDPDRAEAILIERGQKQLAKKAGRVANEGLVTSYIHAGGKIGVLVEINSETDFVARNANFVELTRDIAMHIAAMSPQYISRDDVPAETLAEVRTQLEQAVPAGKPAAVVQKIVEGRLNKWCEEHCLLEQPFVKDDDLTVGELIANAVGKLGERIAVRRFAKFALGE